jgi:hypothetical protein
VDWRADKNLAWLINEGTQTEYLSTGIEDDLETYKNNRFSLPQGFLR